jgi:protein-tyrosine-phosphatase
MFTLEFICKRNAERSVIAHATTADYVLRECLQDKFGITSSGVLAQEHETPWSWLEHRVVEYFRTPALAAYGLSHAEKPRLTRPREEVDLVLAFEPWIADRARKRYATLPAPPRVETIQDYAGMPLPSIRGIRKFRRYCGLIEAMHDAAPRITGRILEEYPQRF